MNAAKHKHRLEPVEPDPGETVGESGRYALERPTRERAESQKMDALLAEIRNLFTQAS